MESLQEEKETVARLVKLFRLIQLIIYKCPVWERLLARVLLVDGELQVGELGEGVDAERRGHFLSAGLDGLPAGGCEEGMGFDLAG